MNMWGGVRCNNHPMLLGHVGDTRCLREAGMPGGIELYKADAASVRPHQISLHQIRRDLSLYLRRCTRSKKEMTMRLMTVGCSLPWSSAFSWRRTPATPSRR
jgi:hypothetical protein